MFSFGMEKAVYVNGVLEATSSLNLLQPGGGSSQFSQAPWFKLIQSDPGIPGAGTNFSAFTRPRTRLPGDNHSEQPGRPEDQTFTKISVGLNVLGAYRENNLSAILSQQLIRSLR